MGRRRSSSTAARVEGRLPVCAFMKRVFISYRHDDTEDVARPLARALGRLLTSDRIFVDVNIPPGSNFRDALDSELRDCDAAVVVVGRRWVGMGDPGRRIDDPNDFVRIELERLLA